MAFGNLASLYYEQGQLDSSVITGVIGFWSQVFILPRGVIQKIDSMCKKFLWNGNATRRKYMVSWKVVTQTFEKGGLGIKELLSWNKSIFIKLISDVVSARPCVWTRWVSSNLLRGRNLDSIQQRTTDSWLWKCVLQTHGEFMERFSLAYPGSTSIDWNSIMLPNGKLHCGSLWCSKTSWSIHPMGQNAMAWTTIQKMEFYLLACNSGSIIHTSQTCQVGCYF